MEKFRFMEMVVDGVRYIEKSAYDAVLAKLQEKQRTQATHNHQFAHIHDLFENLPMCHANAPYAASPDAFRKHGLIATGHCDVETIDLGTHEAALDKAPFVADLARKAHGYALTVVRGPLIVCSTPHSQSYKAMGKERFQKSKADVIEWAERMLEVRA